MSTVDVRQEPRRCATVNTALSACRLNSSAVKTSRGGVKAKAVLSFLATGAIRLTQTFTIPEQIFRRLDGMTDDGMMADGTLGPVVIVPRLLWRRSAHLKSARLAPSARIHAVKILTANPLRQINPSVFAFDDQNSVASPRATFDFPESPQ